MWILAQSAKLVNPSGTSALATRSGGERLPRERPSRVPYQWWSPTAFGWDPKSWSRRRRRTPLRTLPHAADVQEISLDQLDASFRQRLGGVALGVAYRDTRSKSPPFEQCVDDASTLRSRTAEHRDHLVCHVHLLLWSDLRVSPWTGPASRERAAARSTALGLPQKYPTTLCEGHFCDEKTTRADGSRVHPPARSLPRATGR